jgi:ATP-dependent RNA helicase DDX60
VRAEIDARFDKHYSRGARKVSATFTRDFRDDNMLNAQIIVTVPACLGILLLSTPVWASSIRHVILDEVHCLGESGGEVWEQLILLIDSPFVALSATLGNVPRFHAWLSKVEATRGREVILVDHHERYNDLSHWIWTRDKVVPLNPCWVVQKMRSGRPIEPSMFPKDLRFLPEHCVALYDAMAEHMPLEERRELDPEVFFRKLCSESKLLWALSMRQAAAWEAALKRALCSLEPKAQDHVLEGLTADTEDAFQRVDKELAMSGDRDYVLAQITSLLQHLKKSDMLPCICFLLERHGCEKLALQVTSNLWKMEARHRQDSGWAGERDKLVAALKEAKQLKTWFKRNRDCSVYTLPSGDRLRRGDAYGRYDEARRSLHRLLEPNAQFAIKIVSNEEIEDAFGNLSDGQHWTSLVSPGLRAALRRGIGIHHAGMPLKYRQVVERLFRAKRLGVVFATSTLALGINMPAKTSVFIRDAIYLNAMSFRQMAGRAGRRGFDLRGHVVFLALPSSKCLRLMRSGLPTLQGNLVLNNSMALRLIIRQSSLAQARPRSESVDDRDSPYHRSIRACWRLVNLPLFDPMALSGAGLMGQQMAHTFRFSLEYLQRAGLVHVDSSGEMAPNDLAAFVAHLFFMEPSNFAFVSLLVAEDGLLFRRMCKPGPQRDEKVLSVLCHLFGRKLLPKNLAAWARRRDSTSGPSTVLLPDLSCIGDCVETAGRDQGVLEGELVQRLLQQSNDEALRLLVAYCSCFAAVHGDQLGDDDTLPVTACRPSATVPAGEASEASAGLLVCPDLERLVLPRRVRSIFVALSGHGDRFGSVRELCATLRAGLYLDPQMLPLFELYDADMPLNAYLLDFFKHGQWTALVRYNKIRQEVLWDDLHSFELVLRAIHAAMARRSVLARAEGRETPFDDDDVLATLESISTRFSQAVRAAGA